MSTPDISVVMSVYNGGDTLKATLQSILSQREVDLEFIVVNDGSSDNTAELLQSISMTETRLKVINQENTGLTQALINGCKLAKGQFIARQDAGDLSLANRLKSQYDALNSDSSLVMVSTATEFVTPNDEPLYVTRQSKQDAENGLKQNDVKLLAGPPHHGSVMFQRDVYIRAGGYRADFIVAQDIDLWVRLIEHGRHYSLQKTLYRATVHKNSISMSKRKQQLKTVEFIIKSRQIRARNSSDLEVLRSLRQYNLKPKITSNNSDADYYYFVGSNLLRNDPLASARYFKQALRHGPFAWKAASKLIYSYWLKAMQSLGKL